MSKARKSSNVAVLRKRAEKRVGSRPDDVFLYDEAAMQRMMHELRVHEVELQMQNEELRDTVDALTQSKRKLAESEALYRSVIETTDAGFWLVDEQGRILAVNNAYLERSGYTREELLGRSVAELNAVDSAETVGVRWERIRREGSAQFETRHRARDGRIWPVEVNATYRPAAGGHSFAFIRDISERKRAETALRRSELRLAAAEDNERRRLAQDLHDDLGQLMAVVKLRIGQLKALSRTSEQLEIAEECATAVDLANRKLRSISFQLSPPMLDEMGLAAAIGWLADEMGYFYKLDVRVEDAGFPTTLDPALTASLFRIIRELLINVAKHAGAGQACVRLALEDHCLARVTISDKGRGFDQEDKASGERSPRFGLLSVRQRIRQMGGGVDIRSARGKGTTVILRVPLCEGMATGGPAPREPPA